METLLIFINLSQIFFFCRLTIYITFHRSIEIVTQYTGQIFAQSGADWPENTQFLHIRFQYISDLIKTCICPIWGQSDPLWSQI